MMGALLDRTNSPADLKKLSEGELEQLADEIRQLIISTTAVTGGHFGAPLGAVELIIGLHYVLSTPKDKIIFDVGHQAYAHKILTGRREAFSTLRQYEGVSGFPCREESEHDCFTTGHGSTSISAALGYAKARDLRRSNEIVVAFIGDGALTGGLALEGLNQGGHMGTNIIIVLNDNAMAISPSVGALSKYLSKLRADPGYLRAKRGFEHLAHRMPLGDAVIETVERLKDSVKQLLVPGMLFEELGYSYLGPIDGHNLREIIGTLKDAIKIGGPVVLHAITVKGKGYKPAEEDQRKFHAVSPFDFVAGKDLNGPQADPKPPTYTEVFGKTMVRLAEKDQRIVAITAAMEDGTGLFSFAERFPQRCFDVGMAEQHAVTLAAGLAAGGLKPVAAIYSTFLQRAYDEVLHDVCLQNLPVVFALDRAGIVGDDGQTHQGLFDLSYLRSLPNMTIMSPKDEEELRHMLFTALALNSPVALRYPRGRGVGCPLSQDFSLLEVGKAEPLLEGGDAAVLALGVTVQAAVQAAERLREEGLGVAVYNARFAKPLDETLVRELAAQHSHLFTVEENVAQGGFGSAVLEFLSRERSWGARVTVVGVPDQFVKHGSQKILRSQYGLDAEGLARVIRSTLTHE